jgi:hypothetical protein
VHRTYPNPWSISRTIDRWLNGLQEIFVKKPLYKSNPSNPSNPGQCYYQYLSEKDISASYGDINHDQPFIIPKERKSCDLASSRNGQRFPPDDLAEDATYSAVIRSLRGRSAPIPTSTKNLQDTIHPRTIMDPL